MLRAVSTYVYVKERLHPGLLDELVKSGAQTIEIFAARQHFDYANRKQHVREIADWFRSTGIPLNSVHAPLYSDYDWGRSGSPPVNIASTDRAGRIVAMDEVKRALEIAEQIPFRFLVQHIGMPNDAFDGKKFEAAMTCVEHLRAFAKPLGVRLLVENIPNELSAPDRLVEFIKTMHFDDIGVCFDCGHAHMMGGIPESFAILKNHICSTHVHDNNKDKDSHLWPGRGSTDWKETMELLRTAPQKPPLLLEIEGEEKKSPSEEVSATFQKLEGS
ncbi:MAG TPA: sugar phosphate isomerase/epimerase family protein [Terriglobales bacterium]|jgi:sugar phosphate isomerase/epimerase|nr:sugar phosphate isomerase/epimerase family protein [Terriglobales bacterium]